MIGSTFVVEFVGLRGVGKTTLAGEVSQTLRELGAACRLEPVGLPRKLALRLESYGRLATGFALVARRRPVSWTELHRCARAYSAVGHRLAQCRRKSGVHVIDEGIFQLGARIHLATRDQDLGAICDTLLRRLPPPDLVVVVEASLETVEARRRLRGNTRDALYKHVSAAAVRGLNDLKAMLQRGSLARRGIGYLEIVNDEGTPARAAAAPVAALVLERYRSARCAGR